MKFSKIYAVVYLVLCSELTFSQWVPVGLSGKSVEDIAMNGSIIYVITEDSGSVFRTSDDGANWEKIVNSNAVDLAVSLTGKLFMIQDSSESASNLYSSKDNGDTWELINIKEQVYTTLGWSDPQTITTSPLGAIFCQLKYQGLLNYRALFRSSDDGSTWGIPGHIFPGGHFMDFNGEFAVTVTSYGTRGGSGTSIHSSSDYGITWNDWTGCIGGSEFAIGIFSNNKILYGTRECLTCPDGDLLMSNDLGSTWTTIAQLSIQCGLRITKHSADYMLLGTHSGLYIYSDQSDSLGLMNIGLVNVDIHTLASDESYIYAGTDNGIWKMPLSEITSVNDHSVFEPHDFYLLQNYPNPFNPETKISYYIPVSSEVKIKVFDVLGNTIEEYEEGVKPAGKYEMNWNAGNLSSGIYFYELNAIPIGRQAGEYMAVKKMILLK